MHRLNRFVALFLLAWMPVQASALPALALDCHEETSGPAAMKQHAGHAGHDPGAMHDHAGDMPQALDGSDTPGTHDGGSHGLAGHQCCTHFAAVTANVLPAVVTTAVVAVATPAPRVYTYFPELPQQPPRATPL